MVTDVRLTASKPGTLTRPRVGEERSSSPSSSDKVCRQTVLAPTYGGPINK
jgi:hypothetical protein